MREGGLGERGRPGGEVGSFTATCLSNSRLREEKLELFKNTSVFLLDSNVVIYTQTKKTSKHMSRSHCSVFTLIYFPEH